MKHLALALTITLLAGCSSEAADVSASAGASGGAGAPNQEAARPDPTPQGGSVGGSGAPSMTAGQAGSGPDNQGGASGGPASSGGATSQGGEAGAGGSVAGGAGGSSSLARWPGCKPIFDGKTFDGWESTKGWSIVDGALHSLGEGRGQIATVKDYKEFRWIFSMRHKPGNHKPCVLVWGHSHTGDAFGGSIQIQAPSCGGWDYRAGHNDGIDVECPAQPPIDMSKWTQCELLARGSGKLRMACCQLEGNGEKTCKGVENMVFDDPTAPTLGPIGYQMHNAGLFDEFKDICIEEDPPLDELITTR
ncbi:MAG TPA: DUF1080 domain-containing protein [Polyangiaceae bacterium]|nr:DUF1080 domain-containing protein [Polyangiaceae bacterium]